MLVWVPEILTERARVSLELADEVAVGLLPEEDVVALRLPWTRGFEKSFGRPDERREYVRSAQPEPPARDCAMCQRGGRCRAALRRRHQQRHRSGEAERLRHLEVMTFRTRLRRTQEARAARFKVRESGEFSVDETKVEP